MLEESQEALVNLRANTIHFRESMKAVGFEMMGHEHSPIAPVFLKDTTTTIKM